MPVFIQYRCKIMFPYLVVTSEATLSFTFWLGVLIFVGGEGCVVTAAGTAMGIGSDIGGSIRLPSFFNGIFGHKATTGKFLPILLPHVLNTGYGMNYALNAQNHTVCFN